MAPDTGYLAWLRKTRAWIQAGRRDDPLRRDPTAMATRLRDYYARYYRDTLGIPSWPDHVASRLADESREGKRLARLEGVLGRSVRGLRLLNLGSGTGGFNAVAEQAGIKTWGIDPDTDAVAIARTRVPTGRVLCAVAETLPFSDSSFDVVYCYSTLEHVQDARQAVREMVRVLRSDGALYLHTPNRWSCFEGHYKVFWVPGMPRWMGRAYLAARGRPRSFLETLRPLSLAECRSLLEAAGARVVRVLDEDSKRPVGGPLWPLVRFYYGLFRIRPYVELIAVRREHA